MLRNLRSVLLIILLSFSYKVIQAQDQSKVLQEVTITSSFIPTDASGSGRNVITISGETFAKLPINSVDELLRYVPGLEVQSRGPMGTQSDFVLRGGTFQQALVLIDFVRVNDPNTGHFTSYIPITPSQIDHVEVLKGASSAIYGSDAVGGVIHIITKAFASKAKEKTEIKGQLTGGQFGLFNFNGGGSWNTDKTHIDAGLLSNNADGQPQRGINGYFHNTTASVGLNQALGKGWSLGLRGSYDSRRFAAQNFYTTFLSDTATEKVATTWTQFRLAHAGERNKISIQGGYKAVNDTYQYSSLSKPNESKSTLLQMLATWEHNLGEKSTLVSGAQYQQKQINSNDRGDHLVNQAAAFAILRQRIGQSISIDPALRLDYDQRSGTELIPQINMSYAAKYFQIRGSAGKTIRQADFTERYNNYNKVLVTSGRIGNPDLVAERSLSYEAGADYWMGSFKFSGTLFQQRFARMIDYVNTPYEDMPRKDNLSPTGTYALAKNISDVVTSGAEIDIAYRQMVGENINLFSTAGLIWLDSRTSDGSPPSLYLSGHAKFLANFSGGIQTKHFAVSVTALYKTRSAQQASAINAQLTPNYFVMNLKGEYFILVKKLSLFAQVDNLFDEQYSDLLGAVMPGRWVMGGIRVSL